MSEVQDDQRVDNMTAAEAEASGPDESDKTEQSHAAHAGPEAAQDAPNTPAPNTDTSATAAKAPDSRLQAENDRRRELHLKCLAILPAFNESGSIRQVVEDIRKYMPEFDILVVDDGSIDHTARMVPDFAKVVSLPFNLGIGGAMQTGYRYADMNGYDIAIQVDADGQHPPQEISRLVDTLIGNPQLPDETHRRTWTEYDMIIGSRFLETVAYRQTFSRMVGIHLIRHILKRLIGVWISDPTSGFRVANRKVIRAFSYWYPEDYPEPEVILLLHRNGFKVKELQVHMEQRKAGETSISLFKGLFYVVKVGACLALDMIRDPWPRNKIEL